MNLIYSISLLVSFILHISSTSSSIVFNIKGGSVPEASKVGGEYYEKYELDYGSKDNVRLAGSLRGFVRSGKISNMKEKDPFLKWWNQYLEKGPSDTSGRVKPIYAADFGSKSDLKKGEHPKLIIVSRKLAASDNGELAPVGDDDKFDIEVRELKSPWLRSRCNFAVRYIVPNRVNIIKMMEAKGRFVSQVEVAENVNSGTEPTVWAKMKIKPSIIQRLFGKRDVVIKRQLDSSLLQDSNYAKNRKTTK